MWFSFHFLFLVSDSRALPASKSNIPDGLFGLFGAAVGAGLGAGVGAAEYRL